MKVLRKKRLNKDVKNNYFDSCHISHLQNYLKSGSIIFIKDAKKSDNEMYNGQEAIVEFVDDFGFIFVKLEKDDYYIRLNPYDNFIKIGEN